MTSPAPARCPTHPPRTLTLTRTSPPCPPAPPTLLVLALALALAATLAGCSSNPPPPPKPKAVADADRLTTQATRLQNEENWPGAAQLWQRAARQFQLLNRPSDLALARHNEAICRIALQEIQPARQLLQQAADSNRQLGRTHDWWRNQIALLQIDNASAPSAALERLHQLQPRLPEIQSQPFLLGLFQHETARASLANALPTSESLAAADQALASFQQTHNPAAQAAVRMTRARILHRDRQWLAAVSEWRQALTTFEQLGHPRAVALCLAGLGTSLAQTESTQAEAQVILGRALENLATLHQHADAQAVRQTLSAIQSPTQTPPP